MAETRASARAQKARVFCALADARASATYTNSKIALERVKNGQSKLIRWVSDFTWERYIAELKNECARQELNLRPTVPETVALSPELRARKSDYRIDFVSEQNLPNN